MTGGNGGREDRSGDGRNGSVRVSSIELDSSERDGLVRLWNDCLGRDFPLDRRLLDQQLALDTDPRRCLAVKDDAGRIVAALLAKRAMRPGPDGNPPAAGYVSFVVVDEARRRAGLGSALLGEAKAWLSSLGAGSLSLGSDYYHFFPGLPLGPGFEAAKAFALAQGFELSGEECDVRAELPSLDAAALAAPLEAVAGRYACRYYRPDDRPAFEAFMARNFPGRWTSDSLEALDAGMRPLDLALAVDARDGALAGFSRIYDSGSPVLGPGVYWRGLMGPKPAGLGPIGVAREARGNGLGLALLGFCVSELKERGLGSMVIDWTDLVGFYGKLGFRIWKRYSMASLPLGRA